MLPLRLLFQLTSAITLLKIVILNQIPALHTLFTAIPQTSRNSRLIPDNIIVLRLPTVLTESSRHSFAYWVLNYGTLFLQLLGAVIRYQASRTYTALT